MAFTHAYDQKGRRVRIPAHWLDHPKLCRGFTREPAPERASRTRKPRPEDRATETPAAGPVTGEPIEAPATGDAREGE